MNNLISDRRGRCIYFLLIIGIVLALVQPLSGQDGDGLLSSSPGIKEGWEYVPGEVLVSFRESTDPVTINSVHGRLRSTFLQKVPGRIERVRIREGLTVEEAVRKYSVNPEVRSVQPNFIYHLESTPNDTSFSTLWGLNNTGQTVNGVSGTADADIDAPEAWDRVTGSGTVVVAVIDTGVDYTHPDMEGNIWHNRGETDCSDGIDNDGNGFIDDCNGWDFVGDDNDPSDLNGHGTHVAGILGAVGNNSEGITGVNWSSKVMVLKAGGIGGFFTTATLVAAIDYAVSNGANIINASYGGSVFDQLQYDAIRAAGDAGLLFIAAAGNERVNTDINPHYPSGYYLHNIISVAASDQNDDLAGFSNYGPTTVDVMAPGTNILSTVPTLGHGSPVTVFSENFDSHTAGGLPANWMSSGDNNSWAVHDRSFSSAPNSLEDSPGAKYLNYTEAYIWRKIPAVALKDNLYTLSFMLKAVLEERFDFLGFMMSGDQSNWNIVEVRTGSTGNGFVADTVDYTIASDFLSSFYFGLGLFSDQSNTDDGVAIDDIQMVRRPFYVNGHTYQYRHGTSMATPFVSGLAALIQADRPGLSFSEVKDLILSSVDRPSDPGKALRSADAQVASAGRINAFQAVNASLTVLAAPSGREDWTYSSVVSPVSGSTPVTSKPLGLGSVAQGGDSVGVQIGLNRFSSPVDIYGAYTLSTEPSMIYVLNPDGRTFTEHPLSVVEEALLSGIPSAGVLPWRSGTTGPFHEHLFDEQVTSLSPGTYTAYILVSPRNSLARYYLWTTSFEVP
jgi:subtilisin family serine protease